MKLKRIHAFDHDFDITVERAGKNLKIKISDGKKIMINKVITDGDTINIKLH